MNKKKSNTVFEQVGLSKAELNELERLKSDPDVALARKAERLKYSQKQKLYVHRNLKKKGEKLRKAGINYDVLCELIEASKEDEELTD